MSCTERDESLPKSCKKGSFKASYLLSPRGVAITQEAH
jgi:hypothetical protein